MFRILRNAWFDSGFMLMRQITEALVWKLLPRRRRRQWHVLCRFVGGYILRCVLSGWQPHDARHHGRCGPD